MPLGSFLGTIPAEKVFCSADFSRKNVRMKPTKPTSTTNAKKIVRRSNIPEVFHSRLQESIENGEPTVPILEHLFDNVISISQRLDELGFTYYNGKVSVIETEEEKHV